MRVLATFFSLALVVPLVACDQPHTAPDIDPGLGLACFERHTATLPPGTQYEGIEKLADDRLTIRIMNGVEVVTLDCELDPDGTLQDTGSK